MTSQRFSCSIVSLIHILFIYLDEVCFPRDELQIEPFIHCVAIREKNKNRKFVVIHSGL